MPTIPNVFICHHGADRYEAQNVYQFLNDNDFLPWMSAINLLPGENKGKIYEKIRETDYFVICISSKGLDDNALEQLEVAIKVEKGQPFRSIFVIPVYLEECEEPSRLKSYNRMNWYELETRGRLLEVISLKHRYFTSVLYETGEDQGVSLNTLTYLFDFTMEELVLNRKKELSLRQQGEIWDYLRNKLKSSSENVIGCIYIYIFIGFFIFILNIFILNIIIWLQYVTIVISLFVLGIVFWGFAKEIGRISQAPDVLSVEGNIDFKEDGDIRVGSTNITYNTDLRFSEEFSISGNYEIYYWKYHPYNFSFLLSVDILDDNDAEELENDSIETPIEDENISGDEETSTENFVSEDIITKIPKKDAEILEEVIDDSLKRNTGILGVDVEKVPEHATLTEEIDSRLEDIEGDSIVVDPLLVGFLVAAGRFAMDELHQRWELRRIKIKDQMTDEGSTPSVGNSTIKMANLRLDGESAETTELQIWLNDLNQQTLEGCKQLIEDKLKTLKDLQTAGEELMRARYRTSGADRVSLNMQERDRREDVRKTLSAVRGIMEDCLGLEIIVNG